MTNQKDDLAPDYIWAMRELGSDDIDAGTFCSVDDGGTKYIRSDLASQEAEARVALAIKQAAEKVSYWHMRQDILAIPHHPEALEAYVRERVNEAKEEGFWIGRSTGGSKAQIDAAIRAMMGEGHD